MTGDRDQIRTLVESIVNRMESESSSKPAPFSGMYADINSAVYEAQQAFRRLSDTPFHVREQMIAEMRRAALDNAERISRLAVEETGMGRVADKIVKNRLAAEATPGTEDLQPTASTNDYGLMITERAPYGVIGAITPSTNPTESIINNGISMVAAGNTVVFHGHPSARKVSALTVSILNDAIQRAGGPANVLTTVENPTLSSAGEMMDHPLVALLVVTGGPGVVRAAMDRRKKVIAAGPGNPPAVVDETADIEKAARDIVAGASMDNNIICIDEKEVLAVDSITDDLKKAMVRHGAWELDAFQIERLTAAVIADAGRKGHEGAANKAYVGKDARYIAEKVLNLSVPEETKVLLCEVDRSHPLIWTEQLMPVLPIARFATADEAINYAAECEHGFRHTASIHSKNVERLSRMSRLMNCSLFVKNGSNYNGMAAAGPGYTSFTIASPTGEGFTSARTFTRERRCSLIGYFGVV
jgi:acyl-CoA reductase-like NAD-dependent aldehyde dehydrogenase